MTIKTVRRGTTLTVEQPIPADESLVVQGGNPGEGAGAVAYIEGVITNAGTMTLKGGHGRSGGMPAGGGVLQVYGTLSDTGLIAIDAGVGFGAAGTLVVSRHATVLDTGTMTVAAGVGSAASGMLVVNRGATLEVSGSTAMEQGANVAVPGMLACDGVLTNSGLLQVDGEAYKNDGSQYAVAGEGVVVSTGMLINDATLRVEGASVTSGYEGPGALGGYLKNSGTLQNDQTVAVDGGQAPSGRYVLPGEGGTLMNTGVFLNDGSLRIAGGIGGPQYETGGTYGGVFCNHGTLINDATIMIDGGGGASGYYASGGRGGTLTSDGEVTNAGTLFIGGGGGGDGSRSGGGYGGYLHVAGVLTNTGKIKVEGGQFGDNDGSAGTISVNGSLLNSGTISLLTGPDGGTLSILGTLTNLGTLTVNGYQSKGGFHGISGASTTVNGLLVDSGMLSVGSGNTYAAATLGTTVTGTLVVTGGASGTGDLTPGGLGANLEDGGVLTNAGLLQIDGGDGGNGYLFSGGYGAQLTDIGTLSNAGQIAIGGGLGGGSGYGGYNGGGWGGTLVITSSLTNSGTITVFGGQSQQYASSFAGSGGVIQDTGTLTNTGTIHLEASGGGPLYNAQIPGAQLIVSGALDEDKSLILDGPDDGYFGAALVVTSTGFVFLSGKITGAGLITNNGSIIATGSLDPGALVNDGVIDSYGLLTVTSALSGSGSLVVGYDSTLTLQGTASDSESVMLSAPSSILDIVAGTAGVLVQSAAGGTISVAGGGTAVLNAADTDLTVTLLQATALTLNSMAFITAIGSSSSDTITALAGQQTLTGGLGSDVLIGAVTAGDTFLDTAAGLNGDTIGDFASGDKIDLTDIPAGFGLSLTYQQGSGEGVLTVGNGGVSSTITLLGSFTPGQFHTGSDGHGGVVIHF